MENSSFSIKKFKDLLKLINPTAKVQFFENTYIKKLDDSFYDYSSEIEFNNKIYYGRGISFSANLAIFKSFFESIERTLIKYNSLTSSNGVAVSFDPNLSKEIAKNELIERHLFLYHWLNLIPFTVVENQLTKFFTEKFYLNYSKDIKISFYKTITFNGKNCIICLISGINYKNARFGAILGLGYKFNLEQSISHSFFEAISHFSHDYKNKLLHENISLEQFNKITNYKFSDHGKLGKNIDYYLQYSSLFPITSFNEAPTGIVSNNFNFISLKIPFDLSLSAIRCVSDELLQLSCGLHNNCSKYLNKNPHIIN